MNFWHMQLHPNNRNEVNRDEVVKILTEKKIIGLGAEWANDRGQPKKFSNEIQIGDIVLIRSDGPLALVKIIGNCINGDLKPFTKFSNACRNAIHKDLQNVKQKYFDQNSVKGKVKCQETGILSSWTELNVDHRQPNTLSIIIDRFIELHKIDLKNIEYETDKDNKTLLADKDLENKFREYHIEKANLRIVRKEKNMGRSHQGRVKIQKKDLRIEKNNEG
jgi:hypothetical protein